MADFNSDDELENDPSPVDLNPFAHLGAESIQKMWDTRLEDRVNTKRRMANLQDTMGAPGTVYQRNLWNNRFQMYLTQLRGLSPQYVPTADDVARFLETISAKITPRGRDKLVPNLSAMHRGSALICEAINFKHGIEFNRQQLRRISVVLDALAKEGRLSRGVWERPSKVGFVLLRRLGHAWFTNHLKNGCLSWDLVISKFLAIALQAATCSRIGDIVRSEHYTGLECLCWEHIQLSLDGDEPVVENLVAVVTIAFQKGHKGKLNDDKVVLLKPLEGAVNNVVCPVKLLLVQALRTGHVEQTSVESLLEWVLSTPGRTVRWKNASEPVVPAIKGTRFLDFTRPAVGEQARRTLKTAGLMAGVLDPIATHGVRYGAARDLAALPANSISGVANKGVAKALGHSIKTLQSGATDMYVGGIDTALNKLISENARSRMHDPRVVDQEHVYTRTRFSTQAVTQACIDQGLDPADTGARARAGAELARQHENSWRQQETDRLSAPGRGANPADAGRGSSLKRKALPPASTAGQDPDPLAERSPNIAARLALPTTTSSKKQKNNTKTSNEPALWSGLQRQPSATEQYPATPDVPIDPRLYAVGADNNGIPAAFGVTDDRGNGHGVDEDGAEMLASTSVDDARLSGLESLILAGGGGNATGTGQEEGVETAEDAEESRRYGSIVDDEIISEALDQALAAAKSSEPRVPEASSDMVNTNDPEALVSLPDEQFVSHFSKINIVRNPHRVPGKLPEAEAALPALVATGNSRDRPTCFQIPCKAADLGCRYTHHSIEQVKVHQGSNLCLANNPDAPATGRHVGERPFACVEDGCDKTYPDQRRLDVHVRDVHNWVPKKCPKPEECPTPEVLWENQGKYNYHMNVHHDPDYTPTKCQYPGCTSESSFKTRGFYANHLKKVHGLSSAERKPFMPTRKDKKPEYTPRACPLGGCKKEGTVFANRRAFRTHLVNYHKYTIEQVDELLARE